MRLFIEILDFRVSFIASRQDKLTKILIYPQSNGRSIIKERNYIFQSNKKLTINTYQIGSNTNT